MAFRSGGSGVTLQLLMLKQQSVLFLLMGIISVPIQQYQWLLQTLPNTTYKPLHYAKIDIFSQGSIYNKMNIISADPVLLQNQVWTDGNTYTRIVTPNDSQFDLIYFYQDNSPTWQKQWRNLFVACTFICSLMFFIFLQCWTTKSDDICEIIDVSTKTPSDFSLEVHTEQGCRCCGDFCCQDCYTNPMEKLSDGQLLAFVDNLMQVNKIFDTPQNQWEPEVAESLNLEFGLDRQKRDFLSNDQSGFDMKLAVAIKKLDNSIWQFKQLTEIADQIRRQRTWLQLSNKKDQNSDELDEQAESKASLEGGDSYLKTLYQSQEENLNQIKMQREGKPDQDHIDSVQGIVSFRTEEYKINLLKEWEKVYQCQCCKQQVCCCCQHFPEEWQFKDQQGNNHKIYFKKPKGEPGDYLWENIQVNPCEYFWRNFFYFFVLFCLLLISLGAMIAAVTYKKTLPTNINCGDVTSQWSAQWGTNVLNGKNTNSMTNNTLLLDQSTFSQTAANNFFKNFPINDYVTDQMSIPTQTFINWKTTVGTQVQATSSPLITIPPGYSKKDWINFQQNVFQCQCTSPTNLFNNSLLEGVCKSEDINYSIITGIPLAITAGVVFLNTIIRKWIVDGISILRLSSNSTAIMQKTLFMGICFYINTGLIPVITGGNFLALTNLIFGSDSVIYTQINMISTSNAADIDYLWQNIVGMQILSNLFINAIMPNIVAFSMVLMTNATSCMSLSCKCCGPSTQKDLQELQLGPEQFMESQQSFFINHMALCFTFAPSMPILQIVAFFGTFFLQNVDKYSLIRVQQKPKDITDEVNRMTNNIMMFVLFINLIWATQTQSNPEFFYTDSRQSFPTPDTEFYLTQLINRIICVKSLINIYNFSNSASASSDQNTLNELVGDSWGIIVFNFLMLVVFLTVFLKNTLFKLLQYVFCCCLCEKQKIEVEVEGDLEEVEQTTKWVKNAVFSQNILDNPNYSDIITQLRIIDHENREMRKEQETI